MFYHLTTIKIQIIKKFHIRRTVKVRHENPGFTFFSTEGVVRNHDGQLNGAAGFTSWNLGVNCKLITLR